MGSDVEFLESESSNLPRHAPGISTLAEPIDTKRQQLPASLDGLRSIAVDENGGSCC
jgi:hypothetical protein